MESYESCPFGYETVTVPTKWPGSNAGCYCAGDITKGKCLSSDITKGCIDIPATISFQMNVWRGKILCILRAGTSVYWAPQPDLNASSCPTKTDIYGNVVNFVMCGTGDYAVCQEESVGCPINRILLVEPKQIGPVDYSGSVDFGDGYQLYYDYGNSTSPYLPIIDFAISEGYVSLQNPGDECGYNPYSYSLLLSPQKECEYVDARYSIIDSQGAISFFKDNNLQNITNLQGFSFYVSQNNTYYLSMRTSILWKDVCHDHYYSRSTLQNNKDPLAYVLNLHIVVLVVESVFAAYLIIGDPLLLYFCYKKTEEEINEYDQPLYSILIIEKFLKIILVPILLTTCIIVGYFRNWFYNLEARCCSDATTNACFGFVDYILDDLYKLDWANFSVVVVVLIIDMISGLCLFVSRTKENYA